MGILLSTAFEVKKRYFKRIELDEWLQRKHYEYWRQASETVICLEHRLCCKPIFFVYSEL